jgi:hypothetical protein
MDTYLNGVDLDNFENPVNVEFYRMSDEEKSTANNADEFYIKKTPVSEESCGFCASK